MSAQFKGHLGPWHFNEGCITIIFYFYGPVSYILLQI